jgi:hypothetical protein
MEILKFFWGNVICLAIIENYMKFHKGRTCTGAIRKGRKPKT